MLKTINAKGKSVLLIGDAHLPYEHCDYLTFCKAVAEYIQADLVINMGDYEDQHAISFHDSDADLFSAGHELELVIDKSRYWYEAFEKMITLDSNHGSLMVRNFKKRGLPLKHLKSLGEVYETPSWKWYEHIILQTKFGDTYLCHGKSSVYNKLSVYKGCNAWQGHYHGKHEITWINAIGRERYNAFTGCGVNRDSLAMAYGKVNIPVPILGVGSINENGMPRLFKMNLNAKGRWDKKL